MTIFFSLFHQSLVVAKIAAKAARMPWIQILTEPGSKYAKAGVDKNKKKNKNGVNFMDIIKFFLFVHLQTNLVKSILFLEI